MGLSPIIIIWLGAKYGGVWVSKSATDPVETERDLSIVKSFHAPDEC